MLIGIMTHEMSFHIGCILRIFSFYTTFLANPLCHIHFLCLILRKINKSQISPYKWFKQRQCFLFSNPSMFVLATSSRYWLLPLLFYWNLFLYYSSSTPVGSNDCTVVETCGMLALASATWWSRFCLCLFILFLYITS